MYGVGRQRTSLVNVPLRAQSAARLLILFSSVCARFPSFRQFLIRMKVEKVEKASGS